MDRYVLEMDGESLEVELSGRGSELTATVDGREYRIESLPVGRDAYSLRVGEDSWFAHLSHQDDSWSVKLRGRRYGFRVHSEREWHFRTLGGAGGPGGGDADLRAPMPGKVLQILVQPGDAVEAGTPLLILEAMKMENELKAAAPGIVGEIAVTVGQAVDKDAELIRISPPGEDS